MSDQPDCTPAPVPAEAIPPTAPEAPPPPAIEPPSDADFAHGLDLSGDAPWKLQVKVQGGTTSGAFDKMMAEKKADADNRRAQDAQDKAIGRTPVEQGGGMIFERALSDPQFSPKCHVTYVGRGKEFISDQLVDLFEDDISQSNMLVFVCPECVRRGRDSGLAQCHARDNHRKWYIDKRTAGAVKWVRNDAVFGGRERYISGGEIMETDVLACSYEFCGCAFKIDKNIMHRVK